MQDSLLYIVSILIVVLVIAISINVYLLINKRKDKQDSDIEKTLEDLKTEIGKYREDDLKKIALIAPLKLAL